MTDGRLERPARSGERPTVTLVNRRDGRDWQNLWAYLDGDGNLHVDGQDFGPQTAMVAHDGEYEFFYTVQAADIPALLRALGAHADADVLRVLEASYAGDQARDLERVLRSGVVPVGFHSC
jgi:hypothetical protein